MTLNGMTGDTEGGLCLIKKYEYCTYEQPTSCPCVENLTIGVEINLPMGVYIKPYVNENINYSINTADPELGFVVSSITTFLTGYTIDLITTGYTGYDGAEYEERVIYSIAEDKYYRIEHILNSNKCTLNTTPVFAIVHYNTNEVWVEGDGDYFYTELDACGIETGNKYVYLKDINPSSPTFGEIQTILKCS
jgi:hypothetical protein